MSPFGGLYASNGSLFSFSLSLFYDDKARCANAKLILCASCSKPSKQNTTSISFGTFPRAGTAAAALCGASAGAPTGSGLRTATGRISRITSGPGLEALRRAHVRLQVALCPSTKQHLRRLRHARPHDAAWLLQGRRLGSQHPGSWPTNVSRPENHEPRAPSCCLCTARAPAAASSSAERSAPRAARSAACAACAARCSASRLCNKPHEGQKGPGLGTLVQSLQLGGSWSSAHHL